MGQKLLSTQQLELLSKHADITTKRSTWQGPSQRKGFQEFSPIQPSGSQLPPLWLAAHAWCQESPPRCPLQSSFLRQKAVWGAARGDEWVQPRRGGQAACAPREKPGPRLPVDLSSSPHSAIASCGTAYKQRFSFD